VCGQAVASPERFPALLGLLSCVGSCVAVSRAPRHIPWDTVAAGLAMQAPSLFFFFITLVTGPRSSLRLKLGDTRVYEPQIRALGAGSAGVVCAGDAGRVCRLRHCWRGRPGDLKTFRVQGSGFRVQCVQVSSKPSCSSLLLSSLELSDAQSL